MSRPSGKAGKQHIAPLTDIRYMAALHDSGRLTVKQVNSKLGGTIAGTRGILLRLLESGSIDGEQMKGKTWEFWVHEINSRT